MRERILASAGLEEPDGRPLRLYRVTDIDYSRMRSLLRSRSAFLSGGNPALVSIFGLFVAEWFRREATSTAREWDRIGIVPEDMEPNERTELVERSLQEWNVELKRSERGREALLSLALQGGIPIRILRAELDTTLSIYFRAVMGEAIAAWPCDRAFVLEKAQAHERLLVRTLRDPLITDQAAEAVHALCSWRMKIPTDISSDAAIGWLDTNELGWRETIPLHLPNDAAALDALFGEMLREPPARVRRELKVARILEWSGDRAWRTGVALPESGPIPPQAFDLSQHPEGRFQLHLSGEAAVAFPGILGHLYHRPGRGAIEAALICELGRNAANEAWNVPLSDPIVVRLSRSDVEPFYHSWPGGAAVRSDVIVFREEGEGRFIFAGTGSVRSSADVLLVVVPNNAEVTAEGDAPVECIAAQGNQALWLTKGIATVEIAGERYRLTCGVEADARWLDVRESWQPGLRLTDNALTLVDQGNTPLRCREHFNGEIDEGKIEMTARQRGVTQGRLTCTWRDDDGFIIDRRRLFALPREAKIKASEGVRGGTSVTWSGFSGWTISGPGTEAHDGDYGEMDVDLGLATRVPLLLTDPSGVETAVTVDLKVRSSHLVDGDGRQIESRSVVPLDRMNTLMLRLPHRENVDLILRGLASRPLLHTGRHEGDLPLQALHAAATHLLALAGDQDARIELQVHSRTLCLLSHPRARLIIEAPHINIPPDARPDRDDWQAVARPLVEGNLEYRLEATPSPWSWKIPENIERPCIVYLRTARGVLTRPQIVPGPADVSNPWAGALTLGDARERKMAVVNLLRAAANDARALKRIRGVIVSLRGLSPQSIDLLRLLDQSPDTLCSLVLSANPEERTEIFALSERLPFLWPALPVEVWLGAAHRQSEALTMALTDIYEDASTRAIGMVRKTLADIAEERPWFNGIREAMGEAINHSSNLADIASRHVRELADHPGRPPSLGHLTRQQRIVTPDGIARFDYETHTTLLAPLILAAHAVAPFELKIADRWALRAALLFDRDYITHAYPHCLRLLRQ